MKLAVAGFRGVIMFAASYPLAAQAPARAPASLLARIDMDPSGNPRHAVLDRETCRLAHGCRSSVDTIDTSSNRSLTTRPPSRRKVRRVSPAANESEPRRRRRLHWPGPAPGPCAWKLRPELSTEVRMTRGFPRPSPRHAPAN